jgi:glycosyltransferase involved in cell wall biosynthesis
MQICFVSRELAPIQRGGIGTYMAAIAPLLAGAAEVCVLLPAAGEAELERLRAAEDPRIDRRVDYRFLRVHEGVERDDDADPRPDVAWSEAALAAIIDRYGSAGPDLIEFCDFRGDAIAALRARARDPKTLARTRIAVRAHTTYELCMLLRGTPLRSGHPMSAIERQSLRAADALIWPGGDVLATYRRFYGAGQLPPTHRIRPPLGAVALARRPSAPKARSPLRIVYVGRFDRLKGVTELVEGFTRVRSDAVRLTMIGGDTASAPGSMSMRDHMLEIIAGDPRIEIQDHFPSERLPEVLDANHMVVVPSRYEAWGYVALEGLAANRPVLATPVGGLGEVVDAKAGWRTRSCTSGALEQALAGLVANPGQVASLIEAGSPRERCDELTDPAPIIDAYLELAAPASGAPTPPPRQHEPEPLAPTSRARQAASSVAVIVPPTVAGRFRRHAIDSVRGQTSAAAKVLVPPDSERVEPRGGGGPEVDVLDQDTGAVADQLVAAGCEYMLVLAPGEFLHPEYVAETTRVLDRDADLAISYTDTAVFGPNLGEWNLALRAPSLLPTLELDSSTAQVVRAGPLTARQIERLEIGLAETLPRTALLRTEAVLAAGTLPSLLDRGDHVELFRSLLWRGWRAEYTSRALVGRYLTLDPTAAAQLRAEATLAQVEELEALFARLRREREQARGERDEAILELELMKERRWWRLRQRLEPLLSVARR